MSGADSKLMSLPRELRNTIYEHYFRTFSRYYINRSGEDADVVGSLFDTPTAFLLVNRQLYTEARKICSISLAFFCGSGSHIVELVRLRRGKDTVDDVKHPVFEQMASESRLQLSVRHKFNGWHRTAYGRAEIHEFRRSLRRIPMFTGLRTVEIRCHHTLPQLAGGEKVMAALASLPNIERIKFSEPSAEKILLRTMQRFTWHPTLSIEHLSDTPRVDQIALLMERGDGSCTPWEAWVDLEALYRQSEVIAVRTLQGWTDRLNALLCERRAATWGD